MGPLSDAHWVGGRLGDDDVPRPPTYFVEAVVHLAEPARAARNDTAASPPPEIPSPLRPFLDAATEWTSSAELNNETGPADWTVTGYRRPGTDLAYISARGQ